MRKAIYILAILLLLPACGKWKEENHSAADVNVKKESNLDADNLALERVDVNCRDKWGMTPLHRIYASCGIGPRVGNIDQALKVAKKLIANGADLDAKDNLGWTPLHHLTFSNGHSALVELYLSEGADVNAVNNEGYTPLDFAADRDGRMIPTCAEFLREHGAVQGYQFRIEMFDAVIAGDFDKLKMVVAMGADVNLKHTQFGQTTLYIAALKGYREIAEFLIAEGVEINSLNEVKQTALHVALNKDISLLLIKNGADINVGISNRYTPIHHAVQFGRKDVVECLISAGSEIDAKGAKGRTALHTAAEKGYIEIVGILLKAGAYVNAQDAESKTPLEISAEAGRTEVVKLLAANGARLNLSADSTLLHATVFQGYFEIAEILLNSGVTVNIRNRWDKTPLDMAKTEEMREMLRSCGALTGEELKQRQKQ